MSTHLRTLVLIALAVTLSAGHTLSLAESGDVDPPAVPPSAAVIQPGQALKITVYREPDLSGVFDVDDTGSVSLPLIGRLAVAGKSVEAVRLEIVTALKKFIIGPQVSISIEYKKTEKRAAAHSARSIHPPA